MNLSDEVKKKSFYDSIARIMGYIPLQAIKFLDNLCTTDSVEAKRILRSFIELSDNSDTVIYMKPYQL